MLQYLPQLSAHWEIVVAPFFDDAYLRAAYRGETSFKAIACGFARRVRVALRMTRFELAWVEAELLPWIPWMLERSLFPPGVRIAADYDDAIFHRYDSHRFTSVRALLGHKVARLMQKASTVLAGNEYIAHYAARAGARRVEIIPTVVDLTRYQAGAVPRSGRLTIGWIGTPKTQHYLRVIEDALNYAHRELGARIVTIGARGATLRHTPVENRPWDERTEAAELEAIDVGIMPLIDSPWEQGKCGYKLIQYMACGKPVVASPVGVNRQIVEHGSDGYLASTAEEWIQAFRLLHADPHRALAMGRSGRNKVERSYSLTALAPRVHRVLEEACAK